MSADGRASSTRRRHGSSKRWLCGPTMPKRTTTWATSLQSQGKLDEAAARYQQALALRPDYADAQLGLATCYLVARGLRAWLARV